MMDPDLEFVSEAEDLLEAVRRDLEVLTEQFVSKSLDAILLDSLFRSLHSLKGLSSSVGLQQASSLAHHLESCLDNLRMGRQQATAHLFELLDESVTLMDRLVHRRSDSETRCAQMISLLESVCTGDLVPADLAQKPPGNLDPDLYRSLTVFEVQQLHHCLAVGQDVFLISCCLTLSAIDTALPEFEQLLRNHGKLLATIPGGPRDNGRIDFHWLFCGSIRPDLGKHLPVEYRMRLRLITPVDAKPTATAVSPRQPVSKTSTELSIPSQMIRVESKALDELQEISKNLMLGQGQLKRYFQQFTDEKHAELTEVVERSFQDMERDLFRLQRSLNDARMIPVRYLFQRMTRVVRAAERGTGKRVRLVMRGNDVPLDRGVLERLHEPLLHLVRNAIDHGIEPPDERVLYGKPAEGTLVLEASLRSGQVAIEVRDDGRGIDLQKVQARAYGLGMIGQGETLSNQQLYDLLVQPGFSTCTNVTEISGRGIGMDVVRCQLDSLCGMVEVDTRTGVGTCMTLTLPVHKTIMSVLVVIVADRPYAMALEGVCCVKPFATNCAKESESGHMSDGQEPLPLLDLRHYFKGSTACVEGAPFLVVVGFGARQVGLIVEGLLGRREAVIRPFDALLRQVPGFSAVAELVGTGPVLLLDLAYLIRQAPYPPQAQIGCLDGLDPEVKSSLPFIAESPVQVTGGFDAASSRDNDDSFIASVTGGEGGRGNFISFFLGGDEYALDIMEVVEIIERADWIPVPRAPSFISGVALWRDQIVPVLDVAARMGISGASEMSFGTVLLSNSGDQRVAVAVERLGQLFHNAQGEEMATEAILSQNDSPFLAGVVRRKGHDVGVLNIAALLDLSVTL
ncbi:MAG: chemotaxis protein CheW [Pedobacter sp.]